MEDGFFCIPKIRAPYQSCAHNKNSAGQPGDRFADAHCEIADARNDEKGKDRFDSHFDQAAKQRRKLMLHTLQRTAQNGEDNQRRHGWDINLHI